MFLLQTIYKMNITKKNILKLFTIVFCCALLTACDEDERIDNETFSSDAFRVLKVTSDNSTISSGVLLPAFELSIDIVFNRPVDQAAIASGLTVSNGASFSTSYDASGSILTIDFDLLDYQSGYEISLPEGAYGSSGEQLSQDFNFGFITNVFEAPRVSISIESSSLLEGESTTLTATLDAPSTEDVIINFSFTGTSLIGEDYITDAQSMLISSGEVSGSVNLSVIDDELVEGAEFFEIFIVSLINGVDEGQRLSVDILDNDVALELALKGILALEWTTSGTNGGKGLHFKAVEDITDLSNYAIGIANNGGGTDSIEYRFPAISVSAGDDILLAREDATITNYFGDCSAQFEHVIQSDAMNQNGNDAIELYSGNTIIETYGDVDVDGTGQPWEYTGSWAYKLGGTWVYGGVGCAAASTITQDSDCKYPLCANGLQLQGLMSFQTGSDAGNRERAIHLRANRDIADISVYGIGISNNGGGSDGREMDLPAISVREGDHILFIRDADIETLPEYLGSCFSKFDHTPQDPGINFNGDDGVELYLNADVIEVYGDVVDDGTGLFWEYTGSWAFKEKGDIWTYAGADCAAGAETNESSGCSYAFCDD